VVGHLKASKESYLFAAYMINTMLGLKKEMSARFDQRGHRIPVTNIVAEPNIVLIVYKDKVQLGFGQKKKIKKPQSAFVNIAGFAPRFIKEVTKIDSDPQYSPGDKLTVSIFQHGDLVKVTGISKGKGFAGGVKRWGFAGGPKTHGQSDRHRAPGSIGQTTTPGRVFRGKKMAGHMGAAKHTIGGLEVIEVDSEKNQISVKGSVPGAKNGLLIIEKTGHVKREEIKKEEPRLFSTKAPPDFAKTKSLRAGEGSVGQAKEPKVIAEDSKETKEKGAKEDAKTN
jgi:large subunit ribosomal protein L3